MKTSFAALERQRLARCRLLAELLYRRLPRPGGWSHCGVQLGTEPTSLALLALRSSRSSPVPLLACRRPNGLWPAVWDGDAEADFWASAIARNTLMILGAASEMFVGALDSLLHCQPLEASWLVRLKFRIADRQVRLDPTKFGWPWVPDTTSWVEPTSMVLIALTRKSPGAYPRRRTLVQAEPRNGHAAGPGMSSGRLERGQRNRIRRPIAASR